MAAGISPSTHFLATSAVLLAALAIAAPGLFPIDEAHPAQSHVASGRGARWSVGRAALALGAANAMAVTLDVTNSDWATFRLTDDLHTGARNGVGGFVAFTVGMTVGRLLGDSVIVRIGRGSLTRLGATVGGLGLALASLGPRQSIVIGGFLVSGLGISVLAPQLADAAARAPGPPGAGFKVLFVGHRAAALVVPLLIGGLAGTSRLGVGAAMAIVGVPAALTLVASARIAVGATVGGTMT